ncbi:NlpC/P60 family protein [Peptoniphilus asaccharolyticus DSM 20463]|uniref:NlpC/P60 family protein n=1 Tax=Peptoniphilus asaccharolyticus DSM 20463 TaxID=573058 RepID=A0A1W1V257_PEPAS|nr:NlpC/P60 family protein [Peptoniphilus asaccharolyticus]MBL7575514.1 C40 family peptidase [Peptoniphilus asaccharolyticus]SMB87104.1 NlpC/P60 family protein [Peptoniphilus asaccharolyticus DSM 20463]
MKSNRFKVIIDNQGKVQEVLIEGEIQVTWARNGEPGKMICNIVKDKYLDYQEGNPIAFYIDGEVFFYGYVFSKSRTGEQIITTTCYDQLRYLKNKSTYQYKNWTYGELLKNICADRNLQIGEIDNTGFKIPGRIEINKEFWEILKFASDMTTANTGKLYVLFDKAGKICLKNIENLKTKDVIDYDCTEDFNYQTSINSNSYNRIHLKLLDDNNKEIKSATAEDKDSIARWGLLSYSDMTNNEEVDIEAKAKELLKVLNRKNRKLRLKNIIGRLDVRAGSLVPVRMIGLGDIDVNSLMLVDYVTHKFSEEHHFMDLEVYNKDISPEVSPQKLDQKQEQKATSGKGGSYSGSSKVVAVADKYLGKPYVWGAANSNAVDCSGLVIQAYKANGVRFPDRMTSSSLSSNPKRYGFVEIPVKQAQPGDVMWNKGHVAIMYDGKNVIEASQTKGKTVIQTAWNRNKNFTRAFRYKG